MLAEHSPVGSRSFTSRLATGGAWVLCVLVMYAALAELHYPLRDADSTLYEAIAVSLKDLPFSRWVAPLWPAGRSKEGLFLEHLPFFFWPAALLYRVGVAQAALLTNLIFFLASLWVLFGLAARLCGRGAAWLTAAFYVISPLGVQYLLRFNHENAWSLGLLAALYCVTELRTGTRFAVGLVVSLTFAFAIKGVLGLIAFPVALTWWWLGPRRNRDLLFFVIAIGGVLATVALQELAFRHVTGESFFVRYVATQFQYIAAAERGGPFRRLWNLPYYLINLFWFALPGSVFAASSAYRGWRRRNLSRAARLVTGSGGVNLLLISTMTRRAVRYIFPLHALTQLMGAESAWNRSSRLARLLEEHGRRLPYLLVALLLAVFLLRLYADLHYYRFINPF